MLDGFGFAKSILLCALAAVCIVCSGSADATDYTYQKIVGPNGEPVYPAVINNAGQIAGGYYTADKHVHGFILTAGTYATFDPPGSTSVTVEAINSNGEVAGYFRGTTQQTHGFIYSNGAIQVVDYPGRYNTELSSLNDAGVASGESANKKVNIEEQSLLFTYDHGTFQTIDPNISGAWSAINNQGAITATDSKGAFLYQNGQHIRIRPSLPLEPRAINDSNQIVGVYVHSGERKDGFLYSNNKITKIRYESYHFTYPLKINNSGTIFGYSENSTECCIVFSLSNGQFSIIQPMGDADETFPLSLNDLGQILVDVSAKDGGVFLASPAK